MAHHNQIAKKLGLKDEGKLELGEKICKVCGTRLRIGEEILPKDKANKLYPSKFSYCPVCKKRVSVVFSPRVNPKPINFEPDND